MSIKMAKTQNLSLNPAKISGSCGRLMCCLKYEQHAYEDAQTRMPKNDSFVQTPDGPGNISAVNLVRETVTVRLDDAPEAPKTYQVDEIIVLRSGKGGREALIFRPALRASKKKLRWTNSAWRLWNGSPLCVSSATVPLSGGKLPNAANPKKEKAVRKTGASLRLRPEMPEKRSAAPKKHLPAGPIGAAAAAAGARSAVKRSRTRRLSRCLRPSPGAPRPVALRFQYAHCGQRRRVRRRRAGQRGEPFPPPQPPGWPPRTRQRRRHAGQRKLTSAFRRDMSCAPAGFFI